MLHSPPMSIHIDSEFPQKQVCLFSHTVFRFMFARHNSPHSWSWALLEKPPIVQPLKNFPAFYETRRFIIMFKRALHWSLSWARSIQSIPSHPISLRTDLWNLLTNLPVRNSCLAVPPLLEHTGWRVLCVSFLLFCSVPSAEHWVRVSSRTETPRS
jgi:hypothetical protein